MKILNLSLVSSLVIPLLAYSMSAQSVTFKFDAGEVKVAPELKHKKSIEKSTGKKVETTVEEELLLDLPSGILSIGGADYPDPPPNQGWRYVGPTTNESGAAKKARFVRSVTKLVGEKRTVGELSAKVELDLRYEMTGPRKGKFLAKPRLSVFKSGKYTREDEKQFRKDIAAQVKEIIRSINPVNLSEKEEGDIIADYYGSKKGVSITRMVSFFGKKHQVKVTIKASKQHEQPLGGPNF